MKPNVQKIQPLRKTSYPHNTRYIRTDTTWVSMCVSRYTILKNRPNVPSVDQLFLVVDCACKRGCPRGRKL